MWKKVVAVHCETTDGPSLNERSPIQAPRCVDCGEDNLTKGRTLHSREWPLCFSRKRKQHCSSVDLLKYVLNAHLSA
ncbi:hypothetical protein CEXT_380311 [Caerostris extrusa]|uniref:Uncharacterized protein n=1 Tax=Caerostris extrusa TaxID=172846 RepID=A0AAV4P792_CAEEX|nr:hypothetical protein CEXT_380311 [Caerostris extrusa]